MQKIFKDELFSTPVFKVNILQHINQLNQLTDPYIKDSIKRDKERIKLDKTIPKKLKNSFGSSHHSTSLILDNNFKFFIDKIVDHSNHFINDCGFDIQHKKISLNELWVQEFSKLGGGHHSAHSHWNQHLSGFYFLKCSELTSFPRFYDPRPGAVMTKLPLLDKNKISSGSESVHYKIKPGDMIIFPGYFTHEFTVDPGLEPFRFIHWNIQYV
jgi:uncharacterized protein (TIGR02466 family)